MTTTTNPMNPQNIKPGDLVELKSDPGKYYEVTSVGGRFGNKVFCESLHAEYFANVFNKIERPL